MGFEPEEVIFAPTNSCNLTCNHCNVKKTENKLSTKYAIRFLKDCKEYGVEWVGFSGGEPFLMPTFLERVSSAVVEQEMFFDRLMTNGVWFKNQARLKSTLQGLHDSGFDGKICVSVDAFHKQDVKKVAMFIRMVENMWKKDDCVEISSVRGGDDALTKQKLITIAGFLGKKLKDLKVNYIELSAVTENIPSGWQDDEWFEDDFCKGPGNVFYVHPDGRVAVCCGYANQENALVVGNIRNDSVDQLIEQANKNKFIDLVYNKGLSTIRKELESKGHEFPGKTKNHCFFCWYVLQNNLI